MKILGIGIRASRFAKHYADTFGYELSEIIPTQETENWSFEDWEKKCGKIIKQFSFKKERILIFMTGVENISGCSLRLCEKLVKNKNKIDIIYLTPEDIKFIPSTVASINSMVGAIMQEYALSGFLNEICLINLEMASELLKNVPITMFFEKLADMVCNAHYTVSMQKNELPIYGNLTRLDEAAKVTTIGLVDLETGREELLFDLKLAREKVYFINANKKTLEGETKFVQNLINILQSKKENQKEKIIYGVYVTDYESNYCYSHHRSTVNQKYI